MVFPKLMDSLGKMHGFKSGPQTHEKWWEKLMVSKVGQKVMKNGVNMDGFSMIQKLMDSPCKMDGFPKLMDSPGKMDGFNSGPESDENGGKWMVLA